MSDFDGRAFGKASIELVISKFQGTKRVDTLQTRSPRVMKVKQRENLVRRLYRNGIKLTKRERL